MLLIAVLSHTGTEAEESILSALATVPGTASCGTDASEDGRRVWMVLSTKPPRLCSTPDT
ncbi:hypothetical protein [Streptomyces sp. NPDC059247]|uniref:hypothetical protein n=1 Tax=Streptomyces sp. NPDC059247 TaxID=3346790 RepID=UPI00367E261C